MKNTLFALCMAGLLGCGSVVIDKAGASSSGSGDTTVSSSAVTGSSSSSSSVSSSTSSGVTTSSSSSVGSGGASASSSSSSSGTAGGGGEMAYQPLTFTTPSTPDDPKIVIGGVDAWQNFGSYTITNPNNENFEVVSVTVKQTDPNGDIADFTSIRIAVENAAVEIGYGTFDPNTQEAIITLDGWIYPNSSNIILAMEAKMANVQSSAACPQWHGCARSGHTPSLAVTSVTLRDVSVPTTIINNPPKRVLRKSQPIVTGQALATTTLAAGVDTDLAEWQFAADPAGPVEWVKAAFDYSLSDGVTITDLKLRRGAVDVDPTEYQLLTPCNPPGALCATSSLPDPYIYLVFNAPESISGSGNVYTLHGTVQGSTSGSAFDFSLQRTTASFPATGQIIYMSGGPYLLPDPWNPPSTPPEFTGSFLWSDLSEVPHSYKWGPNHNPPTSFSSDDWTNDVWANITGMSWTLTSP